MLFSYVCLSFSLVCLFLYQSACLSCCLSFSSVCVATSLSVCLYVCLYCLYFLFVCPFCLYAASLRFAFVLTPIHSFRPQTKNFQSVLRLNNLFSKYWRRPLPNLVSSVVYGVTQKATWYATFFNDALGAQIARPLCKYHIHARSQYAPTCRNLPGFEPGLFVVEKAARVWRPHVHT